jgi:hypothetical protein
MATISESNGRIFVPKQAADCPYSALIYGDYNWSVVSQIEREP